MVLFLFILQTGLTLIYIKSIIMVLSITPLLIEGGTLWQLKIIVWTIK